MILRTALYGKDIDRLKLSEQKISWEYSFRLCFVRRNNKRQL